MSTLTPWQQEAIHATGNVLVSAGAGTGKTGTVVQRALRLIVEERVSVDSILMVTFTEAAAAEMRARLRKGLEKLRDELTAEAALDSRLSTLDEQLALLDTARISTLHGFCLQLIREHFHELEIDPQVTVLDETQAQPLIHATLDDLFRSCYERGTPFADAALALVRDYGGGSEEKIRGLILKLHRHTQTLPQPELWLAHEATRLDADTPTDWPELFVAAVSEWRREWLEEVQHYAEAENVRRCFAALHACPAAPGFDEAAKAVREVVEAHAAEWVRGTAGKFRDPIKKFFEEAKFLHSLAGPESLREDWRRMRGPMRALLELTRAFTREFTRAKRALGGVDFADLEQFALRCLMDDSGTPTAAAQTWRQQFTHVFVDECQDINAAQDAIIRAVSHADDAGNRFLVGDVKQSIYRFRLADPTIFRRYEDAWRGASGAGVPPAARPLAVPAEVPPGGTPSGQAAAGTAAPLPETGRRIPLADNFRSREPILNFVNPLFTALMHETLGGVRYDEDARLRFGDPAGRVGLSAADPTRRVELQVLHRGDDETSEETSGDGEAEDEGAGEVVDLGAVEAEARLIATHLRELRRTGHEIWDVEKKCPRGVEWRDMVVLLRSPGPRVEAFAKEFARAGVPLAAARAGFFSALEVLDLINLLRLLDNPLQDIPLAAVLRSPLFGFSADELAAIRVAAGREGNFFAALNRFHFQARPDESAAALSAREKTRRFRESFARWRGLARHTSLSQCLEAALTETDYEAQLLAGERGRERAANVRRLLELARNYDPFQRQGLYRFLRFVDEQQDAGLDQDVAATDSGNAVRLMSIHRSKGLEFSVVAVGCLASPFNQKDLQQDILLSPALGLAAKILCPESQRRYPSLPWWLARRRERRELLGEEIRLLYVAMTRARDTLLLTAFESGKRGESPWPSGRREPLAERELLSARSYWDWLRAWLETATQESDWASESAGANALLAWQRRPASQLNVLPEPPSAATDRDADEPRVFDATTLRARLAWNYPWPHAPVETAKTNVSALRRRRAEDDEEARTPFHPRRVTRSDLNAADIGSVHHLFLQHVRLTRAGSLLDLRNEAERLADTRQLTRPQVAALDFEALLNFWQSPLGREIQAEPPENVHRELPFTTRFTPAELRALGLRCEDGGPDDFIVVQGVVDLAVLREDALTILDFKTDTFPPGQLEARTNHHTPQLRLYAAALGRIYDRPVAKLALHFLSVSETRLISAG